MSNCRRLMTSLYPAVMVYRSKRAGRASWATTTGSGQPDSADSAAHTGTPKTWSMWPWE